MRGLGFILGVIVCVVFFGPGVFACFVVLLAVVGAGAEAAIAGGIVLAVVYIAAIGIKVFFFDK
jgi:hypothetical protein